MARNGSGQYNLPYDWNDDKAKGIKVLASRMQAQDEDIGNALTGSLAADGQTPLTGDLDFNNNKAVDLSDGSDLGDAINVSQAQTGEAQFYGVSTTTPAGTDGEDYDVAAFATIATYPTYVRFSFICHFTSIVAPNARLNALAAKNLVKSDGDNGYVALEVADMIADKEYIAVYNEDISTTEIVIENPENPIFEKITIRDADGIKKATTSAYGVSYLPSFITIANNVSDANNDIDFSAGVFQFSDGSGQAVATAMTKRLDGVWVAGTGQGGLDTGTKANSTWYYCYAIYNPTTLASDFLFSTNATIPISLPSGFTKYKRLTNAAIVTDGSGNLIPFVKTGQLTTFTTKIDDFVINSSTATNVKTNFSVTVPNTTNIIGNYEVALVDSAATFIIVFASNGVDVAPTQSNASIQVGSASTRATRPTMLYTTSSQISYRTDSSKTVTLFRVSTLGFYDYN